MHGGKAGGPTGSRNGAYRTGKYTREAKAVSKYFRKMAKDGEALVGTLAGLLGTKPLEALRRKRHVRRALAEAKKAKEEAK
jgi:hypothetical protein